MKDDNTGIWILIAILIFCLMITMIYTGYYPFGHSSCENVTGACFT